MTFWRARLPVLLPSADPIASLLASFAALAVGFMFRPLGAIVFGKIGDQFRRKTVFVAADDGRHPRHRAESVISLR
jgi:MFS family permease